VITVVEHISLDGVMQAPAGAEEDTRGGFARGGWAAPYQDEALLRLVGPGTGGAGGGLMLGRRTYEHFFSVWPARAGDGNPFSEILNRTTKYVVSSTLAEPLPWESSVLLRAVERPPVDVTVLGSGVLVQSLLAAGLVDRMLLAIYPVVLGSGRRLFADTPADLELVESEATSKGVIYAQYRRRAQAS
jgi:dihydrofolate reductase